MASGKQARHYNSKSKLTKRKIILIVIIAIVILAVISVVLLTGMKSGGENADIFKRGDKITVDDPVLGEIEVGAIQGAKKNTYENENFKIDENGYKAYYIDGKKASCTGIDLSEYQGDIDFEAVKNSGVDYVMLRLGGRYYSDEGMLFVDMQFDTYYEEAKKAGLDVGVYFFSQATDVSEAEDEARFIVRKLNGKKLDYPIAFDWETIEGDNARTDYVTETELTDMAIAFCDTINEAGYRSMIYSNTTLMYFTYQLERLQDYDFWIADYEEYPSMHYLFTMWQYDTNGQVDGIDGAVDLNICLKKY
ncbi:MAG: glycoside hydrolase family 25 protein [Oscillospiraceae bacterium]|nr:glycoside hydrolase family 25 protein [Candidatus Ruminococcus equi]